MTKQVLIFPSTMTTQSTLLTLPISELNLFLRDWIDSCPPLNDIWVIGEIGNFRRQSGSQRYFTLSEGDSTIQCVIFEADDPRFDGPYKDGVAVLARGRVRYFNRRGTLQFQINYMMPKGTGSIAQNLEKLKQKLMLEGLFDDEKKRPIPRYPQKMAVITAPDSAASADVIALLAQHAPAIEVVIIETVMQGMACVSSVESALSTAAKLSDIDVILISRGGGSAEDLLPFSDERLVRRIRASPIPIVTAIGHEINSSLSDLAADATYPTPSAAALALSFQYKQLPIFLLSAVADANRLIEMQWAEWQTFVDDYIGVSMIEINRIEADISLQIEGVFRELELLSPLRKLTQGFSIARVKNGSAIRSVNAITPGATLYVTLSDGEIISTVNQTIPHATH